ncbi:MAG: 3'-5' exoribonuclease [Propionibacteriaceae bacterium]|jgi:DNA polymerase-3 subunit epsilon|nr:3'-5' exoribonuclease [Propionibacteriaceae bacterium]
MPSYAVIDTETTGFTNRDRVIEIAVVGLRPDGTIEGAWETLVNPHRDLGPQHIHGIHAADARLAPSFEDIAGDLASILQHRIIVAHNAPFDLRLLGAEYDRLGVSHAVTKNDYICTLHLARRVLPGARQDLASCCALAGIEQHHAHSALGDALTTARLFTVLADHVGGLDALVDTFRIDDSAELWPHLPIRQTPLVRRGAASQTPAAAKKESTDDSPTLGPGDMIVFTGTSGEMSRSTMQQIARQAGLVVHSNVTKKVRVLIAADPETLSGKARKASEYGIPIITEENFLRLIERL